MATFAIYSIFAPKKIPNLFIYLFMQQLLELEFKTLHSSFRHYRTQKKKKNPNKFQDKSSLWLELKLGKFGFCLERKFEL